MNIVEVKHLKKSYKGVEAVRDISFEIEAGIIFGMLGPNGAGKTTTMECVAGIRKPDQGEITILDMDVLTAGKKLYDVVGVQLQETMYQPKARVGEILDLFSAMYENTIDYRPWLNRFDLSDKTKSYMSELSGGQRQKVSIILALIANPKVVFLDELTTGLDPASRRDMWACIRDLKKEGKTVFMTTHYMEEAAYLCDKICLIDNGEIVVLDDVDHVIKHAELSHEFKFKANIKAAKLIEERLDHVESVVVDDDFIRVFSKHDDLLTDIIMLLKEEGISYKHFDIIRPGLEDAYLKLTGKSWEA